jgi:tetratricopeptide (TPR) repeat protein
MLELKPLLPLFFSVIGVLILFMTFRHKLERDTKREKKNLERYFTNEHHALFARKKELPETLFIKADCKSIPAVNDDDCIELYHQIVKYCNYKMTNLKGYTNLELKEAYGIAHFENITCYEKNYLTFMDILVNYGSILYEKGYTKEAVSVLETALGYQCDLSKCYMILSDIYVEQHAGNALDRLEDAAKKNMKGSYYLGKVLSKIQSAKQAID